MIRYYICVSGYVQGVGFRYFVNYTAIRNNLTGWVKNLPDGDVEMEVQGSKENINIFLKTIKKGNGYSQINNMKIKQINTKLEYKFKVTT